MNSLSNVLTERSQLKDVLLVFVKTIPDTLSHGKETQTAFQGSSVRQNARRQKLRLVSMSLHIST